MVNNEKIMFLPMQVGALTHDALPWPEAQSGGKTWATPESLPQLFSALDAYKGSALRLLAGAPLNPRS